jgi:hypothetical protein
MNTGDHAAYVTQTQNGILYCTHAIHDPREPPRYYCPSIEHVIDRGEDADWIVPGSQVMFNLFENEPDSITAVWIQEFPIVGEVYRMISKHTRDSGGTTAIDLGVWMPGEGRRSIRAAMLQTISGLIDPRDVGTKDRTRLYTKCPSLAHGLHEDRLMREKAARTDTTYKAQCLFNIVMEKMCTECLHGVKELSQKNFGVVGDDITASLTVNWNPQGGLNA